MLTVLDPAVLLEEQADGSSKTNFIVALRGDEQLALLVDEKGAALAAEVTKTMRQAELCWELSSTTKT